MSSKVILAYSRVDGLELADNIRKMLDGESVSISEEIETIPDIWEPVVILFILTPATFTDTELISFVKQIVKSDLPLVAIVDDLEKRLFEKLPAELAFLREKDAVGLSSQRKEDLLHKIGGFLGHTAFTKDQRLFISYRRKDSQLQVDKIEKYLWSERFQVFLDTEQIEGGAPVQKRITEQIFDKDLLLVIDSENINSSEWVKHEIITAFTYRIPICVVKLEPNINMSLVRDMPQIAWDNDDPRILEKIKLMISRAISYRESFDVRVKRTLQETVNVINLSLLETQRRRYIISKGRKKLLFEYENMHISLERLHRLYKGLEDTKGCSKAMFIGGDLPTAKLTLEAIDWAKGKSHLEVFHLVELYSKLISFFN